MPLSQDAKKTIISDYQLAEADTGSTAVQVALLSTRIAELTEHLKINPKDFACRRGLLMMVGKRRRLLNYYKRQSSPETYKAMLERLNLRK